MILNLKKRCEGQPSRFHLQMAQESSDPTQQGSFTRNTLVGAGAGEQLVQLKKELFKTSLLSFWMISNL